MSRKQTQNNLSDGFTASRTQKRTGALLEQMGEEVQETSKRREKRRSWQQNECQGLFDFKPTVWQQDFLEVIEDHKLVFCDSVAGVGKTATALYFACKDYLADATRQIVFVRTPAEMGGDQIGFLPGAATLDEKLGLHFESTKILIEEFIGKSKFEADLGKRIHFTIPNFALGHTRTNCTYILDEAQLLQPLIMKLLLERIGEGTKTVVLGSSGQLYADSKGRNGMRDALKRFFYENGDKKYKDIGFYRFPVDAIMRDSIVMDIVRAYDDPNT